MPRARDGYRQLATMVPEGQLAALDALAERTGRSVAQEVAHAIERHLAHEPRIVAAPLPEVDVEVKPAAKKRGRPRKAKGVA